MCNQLGFLKRRAILLKPWAILLLGCACGAVVGPWVSPTNAQFSPEASTDRAPTTGVWKKVAQALETVDQMHRDVSGASTSPTEAFEATCDSPRPSVARAEALRAESRHAARTIGLDVEARYGTASGGVVGTDEFGGDLSGTYVGLGWDLLSGGFWDSLYRNDLLKTRARTERLRGRLTHLQRTEACRARQVRRKFDVMDDSLTQMRLALGQHHQQLIRRAYLNNHTGLERLLEVQEQLESAQQRQRDLQRHLPPPQSTFRQFPPLWDLDFAALRSAQHGDSLRRALGTAARQEVRLEDQLSGEARLNVFGRYRFEQLATQQGDVELGLRFRYPLSSLWSGDDVDEANRLRALQQDEQQALQEQQNDLEEIQDRFESAQRGALRSHYQAMEVRERVRQQLVLHRRDSSEADVDRALSQTQQLLDSVFEKIEAYREVYVLVGRAFRAAREPFDPSLLQPQDIRSFQWRGRTGARAVYMWSESIQKHRTSHILNLAEAQDIERLIVSAGRTVSPDKRIRLRKQARQRGLQTETLLAANGWVTSGGVERARKRIAGLDLTDHTLHLDVEPHALDDFDSRQEEYLNRYLDVLRAARKASSADTLAVSVPLLGVWPKWVYEELRPLVDRVYFMAYGEASARDRARRALETARLFAPEQRAVALRATDFSSGWELEKTVSAIVGVVDTERVALQDFEAISKMMRADQ